MNRSRNKTARVRRWRQIAIAYLILAILMIPSKPVAATPAIPAWRLDSPWSTEQAIVTVGHDTLIAEIADSDALRQRGLGYRDGLAPGTAMLFVFGGPSVHTFWMKGMRFCLDIVWIETGTIRGAAENACPVPGASDVDLPRYPSPEPVTYVLEVPGGWLAAHGYGKDTPVTIQFPS